MKNLFFIFGITLFIFSCQKHEIVPQQPVVIPTPVDSTNVIDSTSNLIGQTWVITKVLNTSFDEDPRSDTIVFLNTNTYLFDGFNSTYSFYPNNVYYTLTLNGTIWGNISGSISEFNLTQGVIDNCQFKDYFTGENTVKIWMKRI